MFYHSFPRPRYTAPQSIADSDAKGLKILDAMINYGLLLCAETDPSRLNRPASCRASFTLTTRHAMHRRVARVVGGKPKRLSHADIFGHFAIGLTETSGRTIGLQPVVYHYRTPKQDGPAERIQSKLDEVRALVGVLAYLEAKVGDDSKFRSVEDLERQEYFCELHEPALRQLSSLTPEELQTFFDVFTSFKRTASWNMIDWLDHFMDHFQTADSQSQIGTLSNYKQDEWRLGLMQFGEREVFSLHDPAYAEVAEFWHVLRQIDNMFFSDEILRKSALLLSVNRSLFFDFVQEVHCPRRVSGEVKSLLDRAYPNQFSKRIYLSPFRVIFERRS